MTRRAITVCSDAMKAEIRKIRNVMSADGYLKRIVEKSIHRHLKISATGPDRSGDSASFVSATIPFIDGLSQEIRQIERTADI